MWLAAPLPEKAMSFESAAFQYRRHTSKKHTI